jgi:fatty acid desaturase
MNFKPFFRKSHKISSKKYWNISKQCPILISLFTICIFPGMFMGQGYLYHFIWMFKRRLWNIKISEMFNISIWQSIIKLFMLYSFFNSGSICVFFAYTVSLNITYAICILPDHDTFETNQNHINYDLDKDWGELQVRHSGNFCTQNFWVCSLFGGINYQIEHHLFPTLCHIHFHKIKPIVEETCKEFEIPYVHHDSILYAIYSTFKQYSISSKE